MNNRIEWNTNGVVIKNAHDVKVTDNEFDRQSNAGLVVDGLHVGNIESNLFRRNGALETLDRDDFDNNVHFVIKNCENVVTKGNTTLAKATLDTSSNKKTRPTNCSSIFNNSKCIIAENILNGCTKSDIVSANKISNNTDCIVIGNYGINNDATPNNNSSQNSSAQTTTTTLDKYSGLTLNDKMVNMFNDINSKYKNTPMTITLPDGIIEITSSLRAVGWTNKVFICNGYIYYNNCDAIEFVQCMHNNIHIHASSSSSTDPSNGNTIGLISPENVASLKKRGYKITDCSYNEFRFNNIIGFTNGIEFYSEYGAKGTFYNNVYFTAIWRCQRPMKFKTGKASNDTSQQSGWITEIFVHGGMFDCDNGILVGQDKEYRPKNEPSDNYQGLKFYNIGIEHIRKKENGRGIYFLQGKNNAVINPRFEGSLGNGNSTSGAYILVEESGYACNNRIETSNYPINVDRVILNYRAKQLANPNYDNHAGSYIEGDLYDTSGFKCGYKAIATPGKMVYEAKNLNDYYLKNAKINTFNYTYSDTEFAKVKGSDGVIRTIGYK